MHSGTPRRALRTVPAHTATRASDAPVRTAQGLIQGAPGKVAGVTVFKNIPFAAAPVGNLRWAVENIPAIARTRLQRAWVGFEGRSPDRQLVAGPLDHLPGFFVIGCASGGFTVAPMAGLLAARHVSGTAPDAVAAACAPRRFEGPATREAHS